MGHSSKVQGPGSGPLGCHVVQVEKELKVRTLEYRVTGREERGPLFCHLRTHIDL